LRDSFQLLGNRDIAKRASNDTKNYRYVYILINSHFIGLVWDWWRRLLTKTSE
jgi:hypothetical protein